MQLKLEQKWMFTAEGDDREFMHRLRDRDPERYKDWINERFPIDENDPDAGVYGSLDVHHTEDLLILLEAAISSGIDHHVAVHIGDHRNGAVGRLHYAQVAPQAAGPAEWIADVETIAPEMGVALKEIRRIAGEAVYGKIGGDDE